MGELGGFYTPPPLSFGFSIWLKSGGGDQIAPSVWGRLYEETGVAVLESGQVISHLLFAMPRWLGKERHIL